MLDLVDVKGGGGFLAVARFDNGDGEVPLHPGAFGGQLRAVELVATVKDGAESADFKGVLLQNLQVSEE